MFLAKSEGFVRPWLCGSCRNRRRRRMHAENNITWCMDACDTEAEARCRAYLIAAEGPWAGRQGWKALGRNGWRDMVDAGSFRGGGCEWCQLSRPILHAGTHEEWGRGRALPYTSYQYLSHLNLSFKRPLLIHLSVVRLCTWTEESAVGIPPKATSTTDGSSEFFNPTCRL